MQFRVILLVHAVNERKREVSTTTAETTIIHVHKTKCLEKAFSSKPNVGSSGCGGPSHVYIPYPLLRCNVRGSKGLFYCDGNKLIFSPSSSQVFSWKVCLFDPHVDPTIDSISEGPIISIRYSLDAKVIAIPRINHEVQFWDRETKETLLTIAGLNWKAYLDF